MMTCDLPDVWVHMHKCTRLTLTFLYLFFLLLPAQDPPPISISGSSHLRHVAAPTVKATNTRTHVPSQLDAPRLNLESEMWRNSHKCDSDIAFLGASQLWGQCMCPLPDADRDDAGYENSFPWNSRWAASVVWLWGKVLTDA